MFRCSSSSETRTEIYYVKKDNTVKSAFLLSLKFNSILEKIIQKEIRVVGSRSQKSADWEPSLALMNNGLVNAKALVTHEFDITQWEEAYQAIKSGEAIKVLLTPIK